MDLTTLIPRCHEAAKSKGFWDTKPDPGQQLMLAIGELGEAQEAHRKSRHANLAHYAHHEHDSNWQQAFEHCIKDTIADEMADTHIRLCDFAGGFGLTDEVVRFYSQGEYSYNLPENFGHALFQITGHMVEILKYRSLFHPDQLAEALRGIEALAARENIDLATHIDLKLRYNATRPVRHGKAY